MKPSSLTCSITVFFKTLRCRPIYQLVEESAVMRPLLTASERRGPRVCDFSSPCIEQGTIRDGRLAARLARICGT